MKQFMDVMLAGMLVVVGASVAGACGGDKSAAVEQGQVAGVSTDGKHSCAGYKKASLEQGQIAGVSTEGGHSCSAAEKAACAAKGAKSCSGCAHLGDTRAALEKAGARVEVVKLKSGYALIATAGTANSLAAVRKVNAERFGGLETLAGHSDKKFCKDCTAFNKALKADAVSYEVVDTANGVMTVFTGTTPEAVSSLRESCGTMCGLKADAPMDKTTASN